MVLTALGQGLTEAQRARWVSLICRSADEAGLPSDPEFRAAFVSYIEWGSRLALENSQRGAKPLEHMPVPQWWWVCNAKPWFPDIGLSASAGDAATHCVAGSERICEFHPTHQAVIRKMDRESMSFVFDLWAFGDGAHACVRNPQNGSRTERCRAMERGRRKKSRCFADGSESGMAES